MIRKALCTAALVWTALATLGRAQTFGVGGSVGLVNDANDFHLDGFKPSEVTGWLDYQFEKNALLRATYGSMRTRQANSEQTVTTVNGGSLALPEMKERIGYVNLGVSYLVTEGFVQSGLFAGIGGYGFRPDVVGGDFAPFADGKETVFGWHAGGEGFFRLYRSAALVIRLTYHNVSAHPHRQLVNADAGLSWRF